MQPRINFNPTPKQLRQFAFIGLIVLPIATVIGTRSVTATSLASAFGITMVIAAFVRPQILRSVFVGLAIVSWPIGVVVSELVLLILYSLVFTPAGVVSRLIGRDPLRLRSSQSDKSNWTPYPAQRDADSYFRMS